jgi:hypothetical protein
MMVPMKTPCTRTFIPAVNGNQQASCPSLLKHRFPLPGSHNCFSSRSSSCSLVLSLAMSIMWLSGSMSLITNNAGDAAVSIE